MRWPWKSKKQDDDERPVIPEEPVSAADYYHPTGMGVSHQREREEDDFKKEKKRRLFGLSIKGKKGRNASIDEERKLFPEVHEYRKPRSEWGRHTSRKVPHFPRG